MSRGSRNTRNALQEEPLRYLIQQDSLDEFHTFVAHPFRNDKRLLEVIERNVVARGTEVPIEKRMRASVYRTLRRSGLTLADIPTGRADTWPSFDARLDALEMKDAYGGVFGGPSQRRGGARPTASSLYGAS